jgi:hypothetical protein
LLVTAASSGSDGACRFENDGNAARRCGEAGSGLALGSNSRSKLVHIVALRLFSLKSGNSFLENSASTDHDVVRAV